MVTIIGLDIANGPDETAVVVVWPDGTTVLVEEKDGVPICRDMDDDCPGLDYVTCYLHDPAKGRCPFLSSGRKIKPTGPMPPAS